MWRDVTQGKEKVGMGMMSVERCYSGLIKCRYGNDECGEMLLRATKG